MTSFAAGAATDVGQVRTVNQDHTLVGADVFAVADGMGGHRGGEVASAVAIEALVSHFTGGSSMALADAVRDANAAVVERAAGDPELRGMGTTMCALASVHDEELGDVLSIVNVGDSRAYLMRAGQSSLDQISEDHSLVQQLVRQGQLTPDDAANHPQRNIVTRALGIDPEVKPDVWVLTPVQGDRYLLCSDGLFNEVEETVIAQVLRERTDPDDAVHELVRLANEGGGRDNISVVVVDIVDDEGGASVVPDERVVDIVRAGDRPLDAGVDTQPTAVQPAVSADPGPVAPGDGSDASSTTGGAPVVPAASDPTLVAPLGAVALDTAASPAGGRVVVERPSVARDDPAALVPPTLTPVRRRTRLTWRVLLFVVVLGAIVAGFVYAVNWVSTNTFYVATGADQQVVVFQGRPGGFLWNQPVVAEACGFSLDQVSSEFREDVAKGRDQPSLADAKAYCTRITPTTSTTTTTTTTTSTTTVLGGAGIPGLDPAAPTSIAP